jgi:serine/threonine-protein kinase TTK/MPS1
MLDAVNVIHEERIGHSDLKPEIFVLIRGALKLIDFGIAKAIANDTTNIQRDARAGKIFFDIQSYSPNLSICYGL